MARSGARACCLSARALALYAVAAALAHAAPGTPPANAAPAKAPPLPAAPSAQLPITIDAASASVDYKTNTLEYNQVVISQGPTRVQADRAHASGLNFGNSRWTFDGHVRIDTEPSGNLRADQAVVEFRDNHISRATITGKPSTFEQERAGSQQVARGRADEIVYDVSEGTVRLSNNAWLSDGQNEISGPLLVYNIKAQHVQAASSPGTSERVHIVIAPQNAPGAKGKNEPGKPQPNPPPNPQP
jgi:lipopolysaccharide transport protein LptA